MAERIPQSTAIRVPLQAYLTSDHVTAATGKTIAITISKNGAAYGNPSVGATNATEIASGSYYVDLSTTDTGTLGPVFVKGAEAATDTIIAIYNVVSAIPTATENADALLNRDMSAVSDTNARSPLNALRAIRNASDTGATHAGELTVFKEDDTTEAWRAPLTTDAAALPIVGIDPA